MSQPRSHAETRLETQKLGALQIRVLLLCALAQIFDGFDISSISMAVPALIKTWGLPGAAFANTFVMSSVGIMLGALASGPMGDRVGRKPVLVASLVVLGISSLACTQVKSVTDLVMLRLITGIGIGMLLPATVALSSDYLPERLRAAGIMVVFTGAPLGGFAGGMLVSQLLPVYGWTSIFWIGGILPLVLLPIVLLRLPESPRFLLAKGSLNENGARLMSQLGIDLTTPREHVDVTSDNPISGLFRDGLAATTILIWIIFFSNLLSMYLIGYWMPTVLSLSGLSPADAVFASALRDAGPLFSVFLIAPLSTSFGAANVLRVTLFLGIIFIALVGLAALPYVALLAVIFLVGCCTVGSQTGLNGMTGALYPARIRNTGMAWALGIGRLGAIVGPWLGGVLLTMGLPPRQIFLVACVTAAIATVALICLGFTSRRRAADQGQQGARIEPDPHRAWGGTRAATTVLSRPPGHRHAAD
jgi:MFS transporter, AAHS family, 4-hydroxybenzoate transporter